MGKYINCGNEAFRQIRRGIYVDKSGLIDYVNSTIATPSNLTCFSRPRRFGKSFAAMMLAAYYDKSCDSEELFSDLVISEKPSYRTYLNSLYVIYLDITWFISIIPDIQDIVTGMQTAVIEELNEMFPGSVKEGETSLANALLNIHGETGEQFFIIIDEWDALFREAKDDDRLQKKYIQLLRGLFKGGPAMKAAIAGAYMTGILPIKKYGTESALTDFKEYNMVETFSLSEYIGFTEDEVIRLCMEHGVDFDTMKKWYNGYSFEECGSVYNPQSVVNAVVYKHFTNYWTKSETYESLKRYISMNFDGLQDAIVLMLGGQRVKVDTGSFQNDFTALESRDDVLTLLVHLGYLAFDWQSSTASIPNLEIADTFRTAVRSAGWREVNQSLSNSEKLIDATIAGDEKTVAEALEFSHETYTSILSYNDENSLSCAITLAYYTARNYYEIIREFPSGKGFADLVFIPHRNESRPAMVVELKYDQSAESAIRQIKERRYGGRLKDYAGELLLVGVNYDKGSKKHECLIERFNI